MAKRPDHISLSCKAKVAFSPLSEGSVTPGGQSLGQRSLGVESSTSGYSVSSGSKLIKGLTERDLIIEEQLCQINIPSDERQCGIGRFRPKCIQGCASIKLFVVMMCVLITMSGTLSTGYLNSVITTIEKRFELGSTISGLIAASYEFGSLVTVVFISYFGGRRHIPRWIGKGVIMMGCGALLFALPHIIAKKYTVHQGIISNSTDENICKIVDGKKSDENCLDKNAGNLSYVLILIIAQILIGTGAFTYATGALGPVVGYALGALLLQFYVDVFSYKVHLSPAHPRWIGAWWGGFIICGFVLIEEKRKVLEKKAREDLLNIPKSILRLLKNKIYLVTSFGICCEISIVSGGIAIPGAVFGVLMGGFLLKRFQMGPKALIGCGFFFFLGCDNLKMAGATFPYFNSSGYNLVEDF
ncbi:SO3A1-like protein [Mya arenaria]|uniref:SO3A1-like protein n=1 Tax=Mya arenaria TaxID=6604 RepID=A0ABY7F5L9_MYAAR|nr:SO3A1-like protein [Mya arenaria]